MCVTVSPTSADNGVVLLISVINSGLSEEGGKSSSSSRYSVESGSRYVLSSIADEVRESSFGAVESCLPDRSIERVLSFKDGVSTCCRSPEGDGDQSFGYSIGEGEVPICCRGPKGDDDQSHGTLSYEWVSRDVRPRSSGLSTKGIGSYLLMWKPRDVICSIGDEVRVKGEIIVWG